MRSFPRNSPEAAARLVALVLIADGHVCPSEVEALHRLEVERRLGLAPGGFAQAMHTLCEDLLVSGYGASPTLGDFDEGCLAALLDEVDDPALQRSVFELAAAAAGADRHLAEAEDWVLALARRHWRIDDAVAPAV